MSLNFNSPRSGAKKKRRKREKSLISFFKWTFKSEKKTFFYTLKYLWQIKWRKKEGTSEKSKQTARQAAAAGPENDDFSLFFFVEICPLFQETRSQDERTRERKNIWKIARIIKISSMIWKAIWKASCRCRMWTGPKVAAEKNAHSQRLTTLWLVLNTANKKKERRKSERKPTLLS